jgi:hypothetical protein
MRFPKMPRPWRAGSTKKRAGGAGLGLPFPGRRVLAVEMAGDDIRAAVVRGGAAA